MVHVLKDKYFSKADSFILPLTGLSKASPFPIRSFLFWEDYSIEEFKLVVTYTYDNKERFLEYCRKSVFPVLDKNGYLLESYDFENQAIITSDEDKEGKPELKYTPFEYLSVFVLDLGEWGMDIEMFLVGKYSKLSKKAKELVDTFHTYFKKGVENHPVHIHAIIHPNETIKVDKGEESILGKLTPIEYVAKNYGLDLSDLQEIGELGSIYNISKETLTIGQETAEVSVQA